MPASTYARFYVHPTLNGNATAQAKKNVYEDVIYIEISIKKNDKTSFSRPKREQDEAEFKLAWEEFETGQKPPASGHPLNELPNISPSVHMNLNTEGVATIEDLAELDDSVVIGVQGMLELRKRARAFIAALADPAETLQEDTPKRTRRKRNKTTGQLE